MIRTYTVEELEEMDTISEGHSQDLKVNEDGFRVWLDRTGDDVPVQYELNVGGKWRTIEPTEGAWLLDV